MRPCTEREELSVVYSALFTGYQQCREELARLETADPLAREAAQRRLQALRGRLDAARHKYHSHCQSHGCLPSSIALAQP